MIDTNLLHFVGTYNLSGIFLLFLFLDKQDTVHIHAKKMQIKIIGNERATKKEGIHFERLDTFIIDCISIVI